jgi:hypothetical protein
MSSNSGVQSSINDLNSIPEKSDVIGRVDGEMNTGNGLNYGDYKGGVIPLSVEKSNMMCDLGIGCEKFNRCSGRGLCQEGRCLCDALAWGSNCSSIEFGTHCDQVPLCTRIFIFIYLF